MNYLKGSFLFLILFLLFSLPASVIDIRQKRIPNWIVLPGIFALFLLRIIIFEDPFQRVLFDMILGFLILFGIRFLTKGKLGMGDVKFAALMAVFIGFPGWFVASGIASALGLLFALLGLTLGRVNKNTQIPFAPFLTAGSIAAYFVDYSDLLTFKALI